MKKIKSISLLLLSFIYLFLSCIFNYSLYSLSKENYNHQYYMITIYFLGEIASFILFLLPLNKEFFLDYKLGPIILSPTNSNNNISSSMSEDDGGVDSLTDGDSENNSTLEYEKSFNIEQPFIGLKSISYLIPGLLDFCSKLLIINGIHILTTDTIFRPVFCLLFTILFSKIILKINIDKYTKGGFILIIITLIVTGIFYQCLGSIKDLYLESNIILGLSLLLGGELLSTFQYILQAKYFMIGDIYFFKLVAFEGLFGFALSIILLLFAINYNCPFDSNSIYENIFCNGKKIESDLFTTLNEIQNNNKIKWGICYFFSPFFYSLFGALFIKYNGIMSRVAINCCGISFWIFVLVILKDNSLNLISYIICIICIISIIGGMTICSEFGEYSINKEDLDNKRNIKIK